MPYEELKAILIYEGFEEIVTGHFLYTQAGSGLWFLVCIPDPDGYVSMAHVARGLDQQTPYLDIRARIVRRLRLDE